VMAELDELSRMSVSHRMARYLFRRRAFCQFKTWALA
jgi:hypothetical protein